MNDRRVGLWTLIGLSFLLAGCASNPGTQTWHWQMTQCEQPPWGELADEESLEAYYDFEFEKVQEVSDGKAYAAVCGGRSDRHVQAEVESGHATQLEADGWARGEVSQASN